MPDLNQNFIRVKISKDNLYGPEIISLSKKDFFFLQENKLISEDFSKLVAETKENPLSKVINIVLPDKKKFSLSNIFREKSFFEKNRKIKDCQIRIEKSQFAWDLQSDSLDAPLKRLSSENFSFLFNQGILTKKLDNLVKDAAENKGQISIGNNMTLQVLASSITC